VIQQPVGCSEEIVNTNPTARLVVLGSSGRVSLWSEPTYNYSLLYR